MKEYLRAANPELILKKAQKFNRQVLAYDTAGNVLTRDPDGKLALRNRKGEIVSLDLPESRRLLVKMGYPVKKMEGRFYTERRSLPRLL